MELIDISNDWTDSKQIHIKEPSSGNAAGFAAPPPPSTSNFGGGIELLMNDKKKTTESIGLEDLTSLENELNELVNIGNNTSSSFSSNPSPVSGYNLKENVTFADKFQSQPSAGESSWDGFGKFNTPINPDGAEKNISSHQQREEALKDKFRFLKKLESLENKGVQLTKKYNMDSNLSEMQTEYEMIVDEKSKSNSVKFQGNMLMAAINAIEFLNNRYDPFDIKIDGWSEQVNENLGDYDEIFGELHEKYKSKASMSPELKLLFQLGGSAMMVHMTNTMFKSSVPGMDDILRQNPELMRQFQTAAVNTMGQTNPGVAGFMGGLMNNNPMSQQAPPSQQRGPPPPIATQDTFRPTNVREGNNNYAQASQPDSGVQKSKRRNEMSGPSDISSVLAGLKTKPISIPVQSTPTPTTPKIPYSNNTSSISLSDLQDLEAPKKPRRKKSDKNTISLDF